MSIGTRSVLFGAHCFFLHPFFVFAGWWRLYGFPWDPRLWVAFIVHDLGYIGLPNMDGREGERHPFFGARIMRALFDWNLLVTVRRSWTDGLGHMNRYWNPIRFSTEGNWHDFTLYHSRFLAKQHAAQPSRLCIADKMATVLMPAWLYLPMVNLTGEIHEYMHDCHHTREGSKYSHEIRLRGSQREWFESMKTFMRSWIEAHKDGAEDTWTPKPTT